MDARRNVRRYLVVVVAVLLAVSAAGVVAFAQPDEGDAFTGCLNEESGTLRKVAVGFEPARSCNPQEVQITWDRAGPAVEGRIAALEDRLAELEEPFGTLDVIVDCDAGDTVAAALDEARTHMGPVRVGISGVCEENVGIDRDDVTLYGLNASDGIRATSASSTVFVFDARGLRFENMTISGGSTGIEATHGSTFVADHLTVRDAAIWSILVAAGSSAQLNDCSVLDGGSITSSDSSVEIVRCFISGNTTGLVAETSGTIVGYELEVTGNEFGVAAQVGGVVSLSSSSIEANDWGIVAWDGTVNVIGDSRIADNGNAGVGVSLNSVFSVNNTVIENNGASGISVRGSSAVSVGPNVTIRNNASDGIGLLDSSYGDSSFASLQISDNGGWGINCAGPAAVKEAQSGFDMGSIVFSGNTNGDTNCP